MSSNFIWSNDPSGIGFSTRSNSFAPRRSAVDFHGEEKSTGPKLLPKPIQRYAPFGTFGLGVISEPHNYSNYGHTDYVDRHSCRRVAGAGEAHVIDVPPEGVDLRFVPSNRANPSPTPVPNPNVNPTPVPNPVPGPPQPLPPATMGCKSRADCIDASKPYCYRGGCVQCILREHCLSGYEYCAPPGVCTPRAQPQCIK